MIAGRILTSLMSRSSVSALTSFCARQASTSSNKKSDVKSSLLVDESHLKDQGCVICHMNQPPVNKLNLQFLTTLKEQFDEFEKNKAVKGVILASVR